MMLIDLPMKGLRRNDDAMKNKCWYQITSYSFFYLLSLYPNTFLQRTAYQNFHHPASPNVYDAFYVPFLKP